MSKEAHAVADWDGFLAETGRLNYGIVRILHPEVEEKHYFIDHHLGNVYERPVVPFTPDSARAYDQLYADAVSADHLSQSLPFIHELGQVYTLHVVSSNSEATIRRVLREAGVEHYFGQVLGHETHASKVEKFRQLCAAEGVTPEESLYLTDTLGDVLEARKVGLRTVAVTFGYHPHEVLTDGDPDAIAHNWPEVVTHVHRLMACTGDLVR